MEITKTEKIGLGIAIVVILLSLLLVGKSAFFFMIGMGVVIGAVPFLFSSIKESKESAEKEEMFLEFTRNLVESVKAGLPISKSIINVKDKPYGSLSQHVQKLANQIQIGIPLSEAIQTLSDDVNNKTIARALTLIGQAEKAGGDIGEILEAVANSVSSTDKLKKERKATMSTLIVQGYIIFFVFLIIILVMQFKVMPMISGIANIGAVGQAGGLGIGGTPADSTEISTAFFYLMMIQGLFSGLIIGQLSEGKLKAGIKHSFILMFSAFLVYSVIKLIVG